MTIIDSIGWLGTILYLLNHAYISLIKDWKKFVYFLANLVAATFLVIQSLVLDSWQAVCINGFWMVVSAALLCGLNFEKVKVSVRHFYIVAAASFAFAAYLSVDGAVGLMNGLGWTSTVFFCFSYFLFSSNKITSRFYLNCNVYAAIALLPQLWVTQNWPSFALEVCWAAISIVGVIKTYENVHLID